jgi:uncharacterized delta-60 repeat protein
MQRAVPLNNGQLLVSGGFTSMNGIPAPSGSGPALRVNANGSLDPGFSSPNTGYLCAAFTNGNYYLTTSSFPSGNATLLGYSATGMPVGFSPQVSWGVFGIGGVTEQPDGKLLVYGSRQYVMGGNSGPTFYRFHASGAVDASFTATRGVGSVFLQPDSKLVTFTNTYCERLNNDGTVDNTFTRGNIGSTSDTLTGLAMQANGQMLVSGTFSQINGSLFPFGIVRLLPNGNPDPTFSGVTARYTLKAIQPDGRILVTSGRGLSTTLLRLEINGQRDLSFTPVAVPLDVANTYYGPKLEVALQPGDGKIIVSGGFSSVAGQPRDGLARLSNPGLMLVGAARAAKPLEAFPNPAAQVVTVQFPASAAAGRAELLDLTGRVVTSWPLPAQQSQATLDITSQTEGIYLLRLRTLIGDLQQKLVIRH